MARLIALALPRTQPRHDALRLLVVSTCALALILADRALPSF